jgi:hypothetical protein
MLPLFGVSLPARRAIVGLFLFSHELQRIKVHLVQGKAARQDARHRRQCCRPPSCLPGAERSLGPFSVILVAEQSRPCILLRLLRIDTANAYQHLQTRRVCQKGDPNGVV